MRRLPLLIALMLLTAAQAQALCNGRDMRPRLTPEAEAQLQAEVAQTPYAYGNHWIATRNGQQIHVIGTIHSTDPRLRGVMRDLRPVILSADAVLFEVTTGETEAHMDKLWRDRSLFMLKSKPYLPDMLTPPVWNYLADRMADDGFDADEVARMQPWFVGLFLDQSGCGRGLGLGKDLGLDDRIEKLARRSRIPIGSLEPSGASIRALAEQPIRDQAKILEYDLTSDMNSDDQVVTMAEAYFGERLAEGMLIQDWTMYGDLPVSRTEVQRLLDGFQHRLIDDRNKSWVPVIERTRGDVLVVAVGGAHLPGKNGLLNLLAERGFKMERAKF
ncbi:TraB family protein [Marinibacterium anthonyi]|nr:TraB family protein [Marinibacterium anthonyi]